jgi:hypothetical protein
MSDLVVALQKRSRTVSVPEAGRACVSGHDRADQRLDPDGVHDSAIAPGSIRRFMNRLCGTPKKKKELLENTSYCGGPASIAEIPFLES